MPTELTSIVGVLALIALMLFLIWLSLSDIKDLLKKILEKPDIDTIRAERARFRAELAKYGVDEND
jgi:hypothetical protein